MTFIPSVPSECGITGWRIMHLEDFLPTPGKDGEIADPADQDIAGNIEDIIPAISIGCKGRRNSYRNE